MELRCHNPNSGVKILGRANESEIEMDRWERNIIEELIGKIPVFKIKPTEGDDVMEVVHRHLLLPLFPDPSDHTSESDTKSVVDHTVSAHEVIAMGAFTSHVQNMGTYSRAWVTNRFPQGLEFVAALFE